MHKFNELSVAIRTLALITPFSTTSRSRRQQFTLPCRHAGFGARKGTAHLPDFAAVGGGAIPTGFSTLHLCSSLLISCSEMARVAATSVLATFHGFDCSEFQQLVLVGLSSRSQFDWAMSRFPPVPALLACHMGMAGYATAAVPSSEQALGMGDADGITSPT